MVIRKKVIREFISIIGIMELIIYLYTLYYKITYLSYLIDVHEAEIS
jgi:hypothetical protein